jgi:hypothetical protein
MLALALPAACAESGAKPRARPAAASCSEAIYTTGGRKQPVRAVTIGAAVFNSLAHLTTRRQLDKPTKALPFYTVKSPLTVLIRSRRGVVISLVQGEEDVALLYTRDWLRRLARPWRYEFAEAPRSVRLPLCRDVESKRLSTTQYAGGFLLRKPRCVTVDVRAIGDARSHRGIVPIGVPRC